MTGTSLLYEPTTGAVARSIVAARAYVLADDMTDTGQWFTWKSGLRAPVYTDCRVLAADPGATAIVVKAMGSSIRCAFPGAEYIVGMAEAGIMWSSLVATELGLPHAFVRKQKKKHGRPGWIECSPPSGKRAVLVDDLMATGGSLEMAVRLLAEEKQIHTIGIQTIVNWNFSDMRERFFRLGIPVRALVSYSELLDAAVDAKLITETAQTELRHFYRNPSDHRWHIAALRKAA
jgi:orotate phosphoribosyltransferase